MTFLDTNVFIHYLGREHRLRDEARALLERLVEQGARLATSAEVLQELVHVYLRSRRTQVLDRALALLRRSRVRVWPLEEPDVLRARKLHDEFPALQARDLCMLASCQRREAEELFTFDRELQVAADQLLRPR